MKKKRKTPQQPCVCAVTNVTRITLLVRPFNQLMTYKMCFVLNELKTQECVSPLGVCFRVTNYLNIYH